MKPIYFILIIFFFVGCVSTQIIRSSKWEYNPEIHTRDDIKKLFVIYKGRSWNYYTRGLAFMKGGYWEDAIKDFEKAVSKLNQDKWSARTYGVKFIEYFPNRELGIAYYKTGQIEKAFKHLTASLNFVESSKTQYYLRKLYRTTGKSNTVTPPSIEIVSHNDGDIVGYYLIRVKIKVTDASFIDSIWINDKQLFIELGQKSFKFEKTVKLQKGDNKITVSAINIAGKKSEKTITVKLLQQTQYKKNIINGIQGDTKLSLNQTDKPVLLALNDNALFIKELLLTMNSSNNSLDFGLSEELSDKETTVDIPVDTDFLVPKSDRYRILLLPFRRLYSKEPNRDTYLDDAVFDELQLALKNGDRFKYIDYDKKKLLNEMYAHKLGNRDRSEKIKKIIDLIKKLVKDKKIDGIIAGTIDIPIKGDLHIKANLFDIEELRAKDEPILEKIAVYEGLPQHNKNVAFLATLLANKIKQNFPIKEGKVLGPAGFISGRYFCNLKKEHRVIPKMKLVIFQEDSGRFIPLDDTGKLTEVMANHSFFKAKKNTSISTRDTYIVITK